VASPYEVLGVDPDADERAIVEAYRRRVKEAHPDHGGSAAEFGRVKTAYEELMDPDRPAAPGDGAAAADGTAAEGATADGRPRGPGTRSPAGGRPGSAGGAGAAARPAGGPADRPLEDVEVAYLDYEELADRGWSLEDDDLFEKAAREAIDPGAFGRFVNDPDDSLLEAAEGCGFTWPYSCRGGACANCAVAVVEGDLEMPANHVLPDELYDRGIRLSCIGRPTTDELRVVYNVKQLPDLQELLLPNRPFRG